MAELLKAREVYDSITNKTIDYAENAILRTPIEYDHSDTINPDKDMSIVGTTSDIVLTLGTAPYEGYELPITNMASTGSCYVIFRAPNYSYTCIAIAHQQTIKLRGVMEGRWELGNDETLAVYNLSNKPTGYNTPNDWRTFYGIGSHQVAYCGNNISTDYSLPTNDCIVTVAWQNSTQANATCSSGENVWISAYENNSWGAWKESGNDVFIINIGISLTSTITKGEVDAAISANKILILKAIPSYSNTPIFYYYAGINYNSGAYIFASIQKGDFSSAPLVNFIAATPTGIGTSDTFTFTATRDTLQLKLSAGDGITIDNTNNTISAKLKQVSINGTVTTGYSFNAGQFTNIRNTIQAGSFVYGIASDGMLIFTQATSGNVYAVRVSNTLNGENYTVAFDSAGVGISYKQDIPHTFEVINAATTPGSVTVDNSRSYAIYGILGQYIPRIEIMFNNIQTSYKYRCATVYNASDTETYPLGYSSLKTGQLETINIAPHQIMKFYSFTGSKSICEHTFQLSGINEDNTTFTYDIVVRD